MDQATSDAFEGVLRQLINDPANAVFCTPLKDQLQPSYLREYKKMMHSVGSKVITLKDVLNAFNRKSGAKKWLHKLLSDTKRVFENCITYNRVSGNRTVVCVVVDV